MEREEVWGTGPGRVDRSKVLKFFVSNIPQGCCPWDLANAFRAYGEIVGAYIARKRDKEGQIFGFVSFKDVRNQEELVGNLKLVKLGGNKLKVNIARFAMENEQVNSSYEERGRRFVEPKVQKMKQDGARYGHFRLPEREFKDVSKGGSFADILMNKTCPTLEEELIDIDPVNTLTDLVGRALVGRVLNFKVLRLLNVMLVDAGYHEAVIQYLGGFSVLISFSSGEETERLAENNKVWGSWFSSLDPLRGQSLPFERIAWINILGVPPHLLSESVFNNIGGRFGRVVLSSQLQEDDGDLSTEVLGILTDNGNKIAGEVVLRWKDKHYRVWISEDPRPWIPDCLEKVGQSVGASSEFEMRPGGKEKPESVAGACSEKEEEELRTEEEAVNGLHGTSGNVEHEGSHGIPMQGSSHHRINEVFSFSVPEKEYRKEVGPTVNDNWANYVTQTSPRPRKRPRSSDPFSLDDLLGLNNVYNGVGPRGNFDIVNRTGDGVFNLNNTPEVSCTQSNEDQGSEVYVREEPEEGEIAEVAQVSELDKEIRDTVEFGKLETNRSDIPDADMASYWGRTDWEKEYVNPTGRSGGLLCVWDPGVFSLRDVVKDPNFLLLKGTVKGSREELNIINVYAPQKAVDKRALWSRILDAKSGGSGLWVVAGDFNAVRGAEERKNSKYKPGCARDFNSFIFNADLCDYDLKGSKFTFMVEGEKGKKFSKIDRVLVCKNFQNQWPEACLRALPRVHSDHNPLLLIVKDLNFGPKPFRFFSSWLDRPDFDKVVISALTEVSFNGPPDVILIQKLRYLRKKIKLWRDEIRRKEGEEEEKARNELEELEAIMEERDLSDEEEWIRLECKKNLLLLKDNKAKDMKERSRVKWAMDGDDNTTFFHGMVNNKKSSNAIPGLLINDVWVSKPKKVKKAVFDFFRKNFKEDSPVRPEVDCAFDNKLSEYDANSLIEKFSAEEIKKGVFECGSDRAPGPDGFNMKFVKRFWGMLKEDFVNIFDNFYETGEFSKGCSSSFITLIPKSKDPKGLGDYRPINLVGIINKVVSKVLANRLKKVLGSVISVNQSAFLKDRLILDGPLILNEVFAWLKKRRDKAFLFKIDFAKAYDNVNWNFVLSIMAQLGFPQRWCLWIYGILSSARSAVLVNGSPTFEFGCSKGMRQGDPISPFLFIIVMEAFTSMIRRASRVGALRGIVLPNNGPVLTHLLYADDCVLMGEWARNNVKNVVLLLRCFYLCSGLKINMSKSSIFGIGVENGDVEAMASILKCKVGETPFAHLGIMVGAKMSRVVNWKFVFDLFEARLSLWKASMLSIGGRVTLIKAVLESIPNYYLSLFKAPASVLNGLEAIIKRFLWGGDDRYRKLHWVAWDRVTTPIDMGGLGLSKLKEINIALMSKWIWRFRNDENSLWKAVIVSIHDTKRSWSSMPCNKNMGGVWKAIVNELDKTQVGGVRFHQNLKGIAGNGQCIRFWSDPWACSQPLKDCFPSLFRLEKDKKCKVCDRYNPTVRGFVGSWDWSRDPNSDIELEEWSRFIPILDSFSLSDSKDRWEWIGGETAEFSVGAVKNFLRSSNDYSRNYVFKWSKWVPIKCQIFVWRAEMGRIATVDALTKRNCYTGDDSCVLCEDGPESAAHLLCSCFLAAGVWNLVSRWCRVSPIYAFSVKDLLDVHEHSGLGSKAKSILQGVMMVGCCCLWKARNNKRFSSTRTSVMQIFQDIKALSFLWYCNRSKDRDVSWDRWNSFDLL
ncbi:putative RNA-directed DNA polymerase [Helianthus anomalus]